MASTMYRLPPILDAAALNISLPNCMYRLSPINSNVHCPNTCSQEAAAAGGADAAGLAQLERRQEAILARLTELRSQVEAAQRQRGGSSRADAAVAMATAAGQLPKHRGDIVVVASPARPPLSLLLLRRLAPSVTVTGHVHSTAAAVPETLTRAFGWRGADGAPHVRVIWKPVEGDPQLLVSPAGQGCPLLGEDQVCRYLARALLPLQYEAGDDSRAARVDQLMDQAARLRDGAGKEKQAVLRSLNGTLGSQPFLLGSDLTLVDGVVWSALRTAALQSPTNVTAWSGRVATAAGLDGESSPVSVQVASGKAPPPRAASSAATAARATPSAPPAAVAAAARAAPAASPAPPADGHLDQSGLMSLLERLNIASETVTHPPVLTVEAMLPYLTTVSGALTKNLFLRDKKKVLYLLTARHDAEFRLADLARQLPGAKELRFGDEEVMFQKLGVRQGCVTPLALANDKEKSVKLLVDAKLLDGGFEKVWFHPLTNEATTGLSAADFRRFAVEIGHEPILITL